MLKGKLLSIKFLYIFILVMPFWYGLFFEYTAFIAGAILVCILAGVIIQKKELRFFKSLNFILYSCIITSYFFTVFWAIDKAQAWEGFLKFLPSVIFFTILMQLEKEERKGLYKCISYNVIGMCVCCYILQFIPSIRPSLFSENGRLIGFFQYSNTFALYLLIGFIILLKQKNKNILEKIGLVVLLVGIILTGSRTVFVLLILFGFYSIIKKRKQKKEIFSIITIFLVTILLLGIILQIIGNFNLITRLFSISLKESTFIGRIIYNIDGIRLLIQHPLGLGYGGYEWIYHSIQTAQYNIRFVHNDILQQGIDTGIVPMLLLLFLIIHTIINKKSSQVNKEILTVLLFHLFFDFDLQFIIMHFILVIAIFEEDAIIKQNNLDSKIILIVILVVLFSTFSYFGIANMALQKNNINLAEELLSSNTNIKLNNLQNTMKLEKANNLADEIIKNNKYVVDAYKVKATNALYEENWEEMIYYQKQAILLHPYEVKEYEEYVLLISQALDKTVNKNQQEETQVLIHYLLEVEELLKKVVQKTNPLAYKNKDKPELELKQEIKEYLSKFK